METLKYSILDPTGNITALVETPVEIPNQSETAVRIMREHPEVEQVGFVGPSPDGKTDLSLRMAGGEFCGNASMSAAAYHCLKEDILETGQTGKVKLTVSGASKPVEVRLERTGKDSFRAGVCMPPALGITKEKFEWENLSGTLTVVSMEGISHIIVESASDFIQLLKEPERVPAAAESWCRKLGADGLGLMFLDKEKESLTPFVYIPGSGTAVWEHSCASGTSAAGMAAAKEAGTPIALTLEEPGGQLRVESEPGGETWLYGQVRLMR